MTTEGWDAITGMLAHGEAVSVAALLETGLGVPWSAPEAADIRASLVAHLSASDRYAEVSPGVWLLAGVVPRPPASLRMPTVRVGRSGPVLVEALAALRKVREDEGHVAFSIRLAHRDIQMGCLRLTDARAALMPPMGPSAVTLVFADGERQAWWSPAPLPLLYGLDGWIWRLDPGQYLRFTRVGPGRFAVVEEARFDEAYYRSESKYFDLDALRALRRFGLPYRDHLRVLLGRHSAGLSFAELLDALEASLGFRPHPPTIRALLSANAEFVREEARWRLAEAAGDGWRSDFRRVSDWFARNGEGMLARQPYRALLMTVGGSPAPMQHSYGLSRPEFAAFVVSEGTAHQVPALLASAPLPLWSAIFVVSDHESLLAGVEAAQAAFSALLDQGVAPHDVMVDYTGGTKAMSAGAVLATHAAGCGFAYVGGDARSKDGVGIVLDGHSVVRVVEASRRGR